MLAHDIRYALRSLSKNRSFTAIAVITLALGIGANTAIFSVVYGILLRPLPFHDPARLVRVWETDAHNNSFREAASGPDFFDFQSQSRSFEGLAGWAGAQLNLTDATRPPQRIGVAGVTHNFFALLGVAPQRGRAFTETEDRFQGRRAVILSDGLWQNRYNRDPRVLDTEVVIDGNPHLVVGVMPQSFDYPGQPDVWLTMSNVLGGFREIRGMHNVRVIGRLAPSVSIEEAQAEMTGIAARLEKKYPRDNRGRGVSIEPLHEAMVGNSRRALLVLLAAVVIVLLIACTNVAGLLLSRATARSREMAIRTSLGATKSRLVRQLLTESVLLGAAGGLAGLAFAFWGVDLLVALAPGNLVRTDAISIDLPVLAFTAAVSIIAGLLFGLAPAIGASRTPLTETLKAGSRQSSTRVRGDARALLVVSEIALAVVLVVSAGLLIRSFWKLLQVDTGFRAGNVLVLDVKLPEAKYPVPSRAVYPRWPEAVRFIDETLESVRRVPGVRSAAIALNHPLRAGWTSQMAIVGRPETEGPADEVRLRPVSPGYFQTAGIPLKKGRDIDARDRFETPPVVLVNEAFARKYFPNEEPLGRSVRFWGTERQIVGLAGDVRFTGLNRPAEPAVYPSILQIPMSDLTVVVHTAVQPMSVVPAVRDAVWSVDRELAIFNVSTLEELRDESMGTPRFQVILLAMFGAMALVLAAVGVYGVISYRVSQRTKEIGVRLALGARHEQIVRMIVGEGSLLALAGVAVGVACGVLVTHYLSALLFGVGSRDLLTFVAVSALLGFVAVMASYIPARRTLRADPMTALRYE
ncbi:MAG TPA: ABC transporter permease [Thermoanaerobaculia bacterium]|nr:ABC transporter permease [Thermoanaerobaculia bacterium]